MEVEWLDFASTYSGGVAGGGALMRKKVSDEDKTTIVAALTAGKSQHSIAKEFGIGKATVYRIARLPIVCSTWSSQSGATMALEASIAARSNAF